MLMTNDNIHFFPQDRLFAKTFLRLIPKSVHPNHLTILRFLMTPFVLYVLWLEHWPLALVLFLFTAFTDALDGSLARVRKQITMWGTIADPIADKILIASVVVLFVAREVNIWFSLIIVAMEAAIVLGAYRRNRKTGNIISANGYGKIKMTLQVIGVVLLLTAKLAGLELFVPFAMGTLGLAIAFAIVSFFTYSF